MQDWISGSDVAVRLGVEDDTQAGSSAAAACALVRRRRSLTSDEELAASPDVHEGTLRWACLLRQATNHPSGFAGYEQTGTYGEYGDSISEIYRLVGLDAVVA